MFNEYDLSDIHKYAKISFSPVQTKYTTTTNLTRMNIVIPMIPEPARDIMDCTLLVTGVSLNNLLGLVIISNSFMYTSVNCYIMNLAFSNLIILLEPLQRVLRWIFNIELNMNLDYVFLVTFATSILTIIVLNVKTYVVICEKNSPLRKPLAKISNAIKGILFLWLICIIATIMEIHMYDHYEEEVVHDIYVSSTVMFLIFPSFIFIMLDYFILYDLKTSKSINGAWPSEDIERFVFLVAITIGFFLTMIPYRIVRAIVLVTSPTPCYSDMAIEITYTMVKIYPTILPIICFATSKEFRQALEITLCCRRHKSSTVT